MKSKAITTPKEKVLPPPPSVKCKHSWDKTGGWRYCYKCDKLQARDFNGDYANMRFWWVDI